MGLATARAILKLWIGRDPRNSGVFSAGNGPAMRAGLLGLVAKDDEELRALVSASTRITHTDPRAERAALLVAVVGSIASGTETTTRESVFMLSSK